jgi:hypothetical protein
MYFLDNVVASSRTRELVNTFHPFLKSHETQIWLVVDFIRPSTIDFRDNQELQF